MKREDADRRAQELLGTLGLSDALDRPIGAYSRGMRQRAKLAQALLHDPDVLLLDEPLGALDLKLRESMKIELKLLQPWGPQRLAQPNQVGRRLKHLGTDRN